MIRYSYFHQESDDMMSLQKGPWSKLIRRSYRFMAVRCMWGSENGNKADEG